MTLSEVTRIEGNAGNYKVSVSESPRYVDMEKCIACGDCVEKCPKKVESEHDASIAQRKAIYLKYPQAVPSTYQVDADACFRLQKPGTCGLCETVCDAEAIDFSDTGKQHQLHVGAVVLAPGFEPYDPRPAKVWGYGTYPNVITSLQLERYLSAAGPTKGRLLKPSDRKTVKRLAFLQCIGSRDENLCGNGYCSSVCCMNAIKEAVIAMEQNPGLQATIFYMDLRTHGKDFDKYLERAKEETGVRFVRCLVNGVEKDGLNPGANLRLSYVNDDGRQLEEFYDMVVLSVGLQTPPHVQALARTANIKLTADDFAATSDFGPVQTSRDGIFTCGAFAGPKDIPQAVVEGSAAAAAVAALLANERHQLSRKPAYPKERDISEEPIRIGVFICHCGTNIAGVMDLERLASYTATLSDVVHVEQGLFSCSPDSQELIKRRIKEQQLNRIVVAACTPRTHEPLFRETLLAAGLNPYLLEMANIRNQNSWVHLGSLKSAVTRKAEEQVAMAVAKVRFSCALSPPVVEITRQALVVGGGVAGMIAAFNLAQQGFPVHLIEETDTLGGNAINLKHSWAGEHVPTMVARLADKVQGSELITVHKESRVTAAEGGVGNFRSTVTESSGQSQVIEHGVGLIATGGHGYVPEEYSYNSIPGVVTSVQFDRLFELKEKHVKRAKRFVFIQCVGSREEGNMYCSKVCCIHSVQSAIALKKENPERNIYILYRDMRTYAQREALYKQARKLGVIFINYELHGKPKVSARGSVIDVEVWDHVLHQPLRIEVDMVVLATAIRPREDAADLARLYKLNVDEQGFFQEVHPKLKPVDCSNEGMFVAGLAHYPKPVEETVAQSLAASARAATLLSKKHIHLDAVTAIIDEKYCDGCDLCIDVCPYDAISLVKRQGGSKIASINQVKCKGCGLCQATCPKRGVSITGFTMEQMTAQLDAVLGR